MNPSLNELVHALPRDLDRGDSALEDLVGALAQRPVPTGRLPRLWALGSMQARVAAGYLAWWIKSRFADDDARARLASEAHLAAGLRLFAGMGYLRGAVMKVGQTLSSYPDLAPAELAAVLEALHFEAPPMHWALVREHVFGELGGAPDELFAEFEPEAFAAASLGQVHRARLKSGERVAVKIQYPGIARTLAADFANLRALLGLMRFRRHWEAARAQLDDVRDTLLREADYGFELAALEDARAALDGAEGTVLPRAHPGLCTARVLVTELLEGRHLRPFLALNPPQSLRDRHGQRILRATLRLMASARVMYADAGPGNFLFLDDGRLGMLDFGCYRRIDAREWDYFQLAVRSMSERGQVYAETMRRGVLLTDEDLASPERMRALDAYVDWSWAPYLHEGPFAFDDAHARAGIETLAEVTRVGLTRSIPFNTWVSRQTYSVRGLLHGLGARFDARRVHLEELERAGMG